MHVFILARLASFLVAAPNGSMKITARCVIIVIGLCFGLALISADHTRPADAAPSPQTTPIPPDIARKIEPALLKQLSNSKNSLMPFVAHFQAQADLRPAAGADRVRQRAAIANALQDTANRTQGSARALLATRQQQRKADHVRAFWIVNALAGDADRETIIELAARPEVEIVRL